jgi:single-strand DNA-binding protein
MTHVKQLNFKKMNLRNRVQLIGNLGAEPSVKEFESGKKMARFSVATNAVVKKDGKLEKSVNWYNVTAWGNTAIVAERNLAKGTEVIIEGKLVSSSYTDKSGNPRKVSEVLAESILYRNIKHAIETAKISDDKVRA